jgi:hypothetical protein
LKYSTLTITKKECTGKGLEKSFFKCGQNIVTTERMESLAYKLEGAGQS